MPSVATGTFDVELIAAAPEADGAIARFDLTKVFHGGLEGTGLGVMLGGGDLAGGNAGYVAIETFSGLLDDRSGSFALQQFGTMAGGEQTLHYEVVPGSGDGDLVGLSGVFQLTIEDDGTHRYELEYEL